MADEQIQQILNESQEAAKEKAEHPKNLADYFQKIEALNRKTPEEQAKFRQELETWDQNGNKEEMRRAGVLEKDNEPPSKSDPRHPLKIYLDRHARLSAAFVHWDAGNQSGEINFAGNQTAEYKVGLGDILPPSIRGVYITKKDSPTQPFHALRARNPATGRIGYYATEGLKQGNYNYVAVFSGDKFQIDLTANELRTERYALQEHIAVYKDNAMKQDERGEQDPRDRIATTARKDRSELRKTMEKEPVKIVHNRGREVEIQGKPYQKLTYDFLQRIAKGPDDMKGWLVPATFMGSPIPGGVNAFMLPYLKEAEFRLRKAGVEYKMDEHAGGCQCYNWRGIRNLDGSTGKTLSKHSYGIALDINPGIHPFGVSWANNKHPNKMPMEMVRIMQECGFGWGDGFANRDPMHFELIVNPYTSKEMLTSKAAQVAMKQIEDRYPALIPVAKAGWSQEILSGQARAVRGSQVASQAQITNTVPIINQDHQKFTQTMKLRPENFEELRRCIQQFRRNYKKYEEVSAQTGIPPELIYAIHYRESSCNFNTYLHQGDPLGKPAVHVPRNIPVFHQWVPAAIHALKLKGSIARKVGLSSTSKDVAAMSTYAETYNGLGYRRRGLPSPYVYAGTDKYVGGMYVSDGKFSSKAYDNRVGTAAIVTALQHPELVA